MGVGVAQFGAVYCADLLSRVPGGWGSTGTEVRGTSDCTGVTRRNFGAVELALQRRRVPVEIGDAAAGDGRHGRQTCVGVVLGGAVDVLHALEQDSGPRVTGQTLALVCCLLNVVGVGQ